MVLDSEAPGKFIATPAFHMVQSAMPCISGNIPIHLHLCAGHFFEALADQPPYVVLWYILPFRSALQ